MCFGSSSFCHFLSGEILHDHRSTLRPGCLLAPRRAPQHAAFPARGGDVQRRWQRDHRSMGPPDEGHHAYSEDVFDVLDANQVRACSILGNLRAWSKVEARIRRIKKQLSDISRRRFEYPNLTNNPADSSDKIIWSLSLVSPSS